MSANTCLQLIDASTGFGPAVCLGGSAARGEGARGEGGSEIKSPADEAMEPLDEALLGLLRALEILRDGGGERLGGGGVKRGMALGGGMLLLRVGTRAGLDAISTCTLSIGFGDGLGEAFGVTISSTRHFDKGSAAVRTLCNKTAISRSGSMVPRCEEPNSFKSVTDMVSFAFLSMVFG